jgi:hypothetical protein
MNRTSFRKWLQLLAYLVLIWGSILFFPVLAGKIPVLVNALEIIREKNIETDALFYTESEHTTSAAAKINEQIP